MARADRCRQVYTGENASSQVLQIETSLGLVRLWVARAERDTVEAWTGAATTPES